MLYVFPFINRVGIELRDYGASDGRRAARDLDARNWVWASAAPAFGYLVGRAFPVAPCAPS